MPSFLACFICFNKLLIFSYRICHAGDRRGESFDFFEQKEVL